MTTEQLLRHRSKVTIVNVKPTITAESNFQKAVAEGITVSEDDLVVFDVLVDDTPSDKESLEGAGTLMGLRWDLDGTLNNDCDVSGTHFEYTWEPVIHSSEQ